MFRNLLFLSIVAGLLFGFRIPEPGPRSKQNTEQQDTDSAIWHLAEQYTAIFNAGDTAKIGSLLPDEFMLQWLHENFLGKKSLMNMMMDTSAHATFRNILFMNAQTIIRVADNGQAAGLNTGIKFLDPVMAESVKKEHGFGLCTMYFEKSGNRWLLKTVHVDLHCSLCNE
jgi:hypothetical protein